MTIPLLLALLLQASSPPILPVTVVGWVTFFASVMGILYVLWDRTIAKGRRDAELNGLGVRVAKTETISTRLEERVAEQWQHIRDHDTEIRLMREGFGEMRSGFKEMRDSLVESNQKMHTAIANLANDLARADGRSTTANEIRDAFRDGVREAIREATAHRQGDR